MRISFPQLLVFTVLQALRNSSSNSFSAAAFERAHMQAAHVLHGLYARACLRGCPVLSGYARAYACLGRCVGLRQVLWHFAPQIRVCAGHCSDAIFSM